MFYYSNAEFWSKLSFVKSQIVNRKVTRKLANTCFTPFANFIYFKENIRLLKSIAKTYDVDSGIFKLGPHGDEDDENDDIADSSTMTGSQGYQTF